MEPLTDHELTELRKLVDYATQIEAEMEYKAAKKLIIKVWRAGVLRVAALLSAGLIVWVNFRAFISWAAGN